MHISSHHLGMLATGALAVLAVASCGSDVNEGSGGSGGTGGGTTSTTSTSTTTTTSTSTSTSSTSTTTTTGTTVYPCSLTSSCKAFDKQCVGLVDNGGKSKFGLRVAQLDLSKPAALAGGIVGTIIAGAVKMFDPGCNLSGGASFSWLLEFDTTAGKLKTGGAKPVADPTAGYTFVNEQIYGIAVAPAVFDASPDANGAFSTPIGKDLIVPIFLDQAATSALLLPVKQLRFTTGTLSSSQNCIGQYNAEGLEPGNLCEADAMNKSFITGASLTGVISLEDADKLVISSLQETLCVRLSGNQGVPGPAGYKVCQRDANNQITFQGDACTLGAGCHDAVSLAGSFAASSVAIN